MADATERPANNRALGLQLLVGWVALLHTFLLGSDSSVLFACVPGMTLLALGQYAESLIRASRTRFLFSSARPHL